MDVLVPVSPTGMLELFKLKDQANMYWLKIEHLGEHIKQRGGQQRSYMHLLYRGEYKCPAINIIYAGQNIHLHAVYGWNTWRKNGLTIAFVKDFKAFDCVITLNDVLVKGSNCSTSLEFNENSDHTVMNWFNHVITLNDKFKLHTAVIKSFVQCSYT